MVQFRPLGFQESRKLPTSEVRLLGSLRSIAHDCALPRQQTCFQRLQEGLLIDQPSIFPNHVVVTSVALDSGVSVHVDENMLSYVYEAQEVKGWPLTG